MNTMALVVGDVYERVLHDGHFWQTERRQVLDATEQAVFYQRLYDPPEGTYVLDDWDESKDQKQVTMKQWRAWVRLAWKIGPAPGRKE